jgi:predicted  nucleic acid-binding Zn-ribbon protein
MENYLLNQSEQLQELKDQTRILNDSLATLTSKIDSISSHNKILETQLSQVVQKISQPKTKKMNAITLRNGRQLEDPVRKVKPNEVEKENSEPQGEETRVERRGN